MDLFTKCTFEQGVRKLLIIEDERELAVMLQELITNEGYQALMVGSGQEALALLDAQSVDAILCDIYMPGMSGLEFMRTIREKGVDTPVAFLTGFGDVAHLIEAVRLGAVDFLRKPAELSDIIEAVHRILDIGARRRRLRLVFAELRHQYPETAETFLRLEASMHHEYHLRASIGKSAPGAPLK